MENNNYVVYRHLKPNGEVFYVGMGKPYRPFYKHNRSIFWNNIVEKYGYKVEVLQQNLDLESAIELEMFLIQLYGRKDLGTGILVNLTDGGDKRTYTEEQRLQLSISNKGKKHVFKSEETFKKNCETRFKKGCKVNNKKVINVKTGEIYESAKECHRLTKSTYSCNHFRDMITGIKINKTDFIYLEKYDKQ